MRRELQRTVGDGSQVPGVVTWAQQMIAKALPAGPVVISLSRGKRTLDQNAKFHALCSDVASQAEYLGRRLSAGQWKVLFISGHAIAEGRGCEIVPGLEGEFVNIRELSSRMSVRRMSSLIEYVHAWCAGNDIRLIEFVRYDDLPKPAASQRGE